VWGLTPVIPALGRLRQADLKFETRLGYIVRPCLKKTVNSECIFLSLTNDSYPVQHRKH
jgi:hypothetical protein